MNQHPIYMTAGSPGPSSSVLNTTADIGSTAAAFQQLSSFQPQTTSYYSTASSFQVTSSYGSERKDYTNLSSAIHGLTPVRLPALSTSLSGGSSAADMLPTLSIGGIKEHPAVAQADQMNAYMEFFVDPGSSSQSQENIVVDDIVDVHDQLNEKEVVIMDGNGDMNNVSFLEEDDGKGPSCSYHEHDIDDGDKGDEEEDNDYSHKKTSLEVQQRLAERIEELSRSNLSQGELSTIIRHEQSKARRAEAARSRYQKMSEEERKRYNHRRRLRALGIDPDNPSSNSELAIKMANAKKAEAARIRYHRMTPEERREYNARRTESFRRRRQEEEQLLSTPAGRISQEALERAQAIMLRNQKKAEAARARYQKMTPEQRKEYNVRRAQSKKARAAAAAAAARENGEVVRATSELSGMSDDFSVSEHDISEGSLSVDPTFPSEPPVNLLEANSGVSQPSQPTSNNSRRSSNPSDDIFLQMEREVMKRTKQAQMTLAQRRAQEMLNCNTTPQPAHTPYSNRYAEPHEMEKPSPIQEYQPPQQMIDEAQLHEMLRTGRDPSGMPVELRTLDGQRINDPEHLRSLAQGQPIMIQPLETALNENKDSLYLGLNGEQNHLAENQDATDGMYQDEQEVLNYRDSLVNSQPASSSQMREMTQAALSLAERHAISKQKRAERARIRYHSMRPELRAQQNAKRADLLRKARQRDERLVQMAETVDVSSLPLETQQAIAEAQQRRARRAEQARAKYHRMNSDERRQYNAMRDAQRRQRKRQQEAANRERMERNEQIGASESVSSEGGTLSPRVRDEVEQVIYGYNLYDEPIQSWPEH